MLSFLKSNWFLLSLAAVFLCGHYGSDALAPIADQSGVRSFIVLIVMWLMGVTLHPKAIRESIQRPSAGLLAVGINTFLVPVLCLPALWIFPPQLGGGLFVAGLVPCTLASASVWTRRAGGDDSIAMLTTTVTNLGCLAVVPIGIQLALALQTRLAPLEQMEKLAWFVVLPLVVAQIMRRIGFDSWADRNKKSLSIVAQVGILAMVLMGAVVGRQHASESDQASLITLGLLIVTAAGVHLAAFVFGIASARTLGVKREGQIAVGIAGSQKTLMVGLQIAIDCGVSVLPMMVYHISQLVIDTMIVDRWSRAGQQSRNSDA